METKPAEIEVEGVTFRVELTPESKPDTNQAWIKVSPVSDISDARDARTVQAVFNLLTREHQYRAKSAPGAGTPPAAGATEAYVSSLDFPGGQVMRNLVTYLGICADYPRKVRDAWPAARSR